MKKLLQTSSIFFFFFLITIIAINAQDWNWGAAAVGPKWDDEGHGVGVDAAGNVYVVGRAQDTLDFGGGNVITNVGSMFIVKYDSTGNFQWVDESQGASYEYGNDIVTDISGNSFVVGGFNDTASFDGTMVYSYGGGDIFLAKYDADGAISWIKHAGSSNSDGGEGIAMDESGNLYITGSYQDTATFGSIILNRISSKEIFIAKYDSTGTALWAKAGTGAGWDGGNAVAVDNSGNVYATGYFRDTINFESTQLTTTANNNDMYIVKYDGSGNLAWAKQAIGTNTSYETGIGITVDGSGNAYVVGTFMDTVSFGTVQLLGEKGTDGFLVKYDGTGTAVWAKALNGPGWDNLRDVVVDDAGDIYVTGTATDTSSFDGHNINTNGTSDLVVIKLDDAGNVIWISLAGELKKGVGYGITVDNHGKVYATGSFDSSITINGNVMTALQYHDFFVGVINDSTFIDTNSTGSAVLFTSTTFEIAIHPNPFTSQTMLNISGEIENYDDLTVSIYTLLGEEVYSNKISSRSTIIQREYLLSGMYFYQLKRKSKVLGIGKMIIN